MTWPTLQALEERLSAFYLKRCQTIADLRRMAHWRVPAPMFHYMDGAAEDEITYRRNSSDFDHLEFLPRNLVDISEIDPSTTVMGQRIEFPVVLAPTGMSRLFHWEGERAVARAAARAGTVYSLSAVGTHSIEEVAACNAGPKWFQIYVFKDRGLVSEFIQRCRAAQYHALCLTIDLPITGKRERDFRTGMTLPPTFTLRSWLDFVLHPVWSATHVTSAPFSLANVAHRVQTVDSDNVETLMSYIGSQFDRTVTWDDAAAMVQEWGGPFAVKGILTVDDAKRAVDIGATAIIVSNHGGRQLDHCPTPIDVLPEIVAAVGDRAEVILDGGVRRGTDVLKALALGARACMTGRCYLYGLGAGGEAGVDKALQILREEIARDMALLGTRNVKEITGSYVRRRRGL
ncbi:MAG: alpha-hydroxy-acid oxidizing protein [Gammaproteobacteria bacterium]|nr:alpha-hydroxy-acid oxidizing protein [Gammaproteobacteria bacterium]